MKTPRVSILMSVYNGEEYLREAIESVLGQTFSDFEFIIMDDGSKDNTLSVLQNYKQRDPRIIIQRFEENLGLTARLNLGIQKAHGKYIARMDADDISLAQRLERQVDYLERNPGIGVVGTQMNNLDGGGRIKGIFRVPCLHNQIAWGLIFARSFAHPSVMMRKKLLEQIGGYDDSFQVAQDYELWTRLIWVTRFANLPDVLINYRYHSSSVTRQQFDIQTKNMHIARQRFVSQVAGKKIPLDVLQWIQQSQTLNLNLPIDKARVVLPLLVELFEGYNRNHLFDDHELNSMHSTLSENIVLAGRSLMSEYKKSSTGSFSFFENLKSSALGLVRKLKNMQVLIKKSKDKPQ